MKTKEQSLLEEYFGEEAIVLDEAIREFKIHGKIYQVRPCETIDNDEEFSWMANELDTIKYDDYYFITQ